MNQGIVVDHEPESEIEWQGEWREFMYGERGKETGSAVVNRWIDLAGEVDCALLDCIMAWLDFLVQARQEGEELVSRV